MPTRIILSVCDHSGTWSAPWLAEPDTVVVRVDPKHDQLDTTAGTLCAGSGRAGRMADGGYWLAMTAGQLADHLEGVRMLAEDVMVPHRLPVAAAHGILRLLGLPRGSTQDRVECCYFAPPCTDFTVSGAQYWPAKDADGRTAASVAIVQDCLRIVAAVKPRSWMLENPVGRLPRLVPALGKPHLYVQPHQYAQFAVELDAERYTKKTGLWGRFNVQHLRDLASNLEPIRACAQGSWLQKLGGKSERTKQLRSVTPTGLAYATYLACREAA